MAARARQLQLAPSEEQPCIVMARCLPGTASAPHSASSWGALTVSLDFCPNTRKRPARRLFAKVRAALRCDRPVFGVSVQQGLALGSLHGSTQVCRPWCSHTTGLAGCGLLLSTCAHKPRKPTASQVLTGTNLRYKLLSRLAQVGQLQAQVLFQKFCNRQPYTCRRN